MTDLSNKIREYRFQNNEMTQKALAEYVGVSRQTMNAIENGRHAPTVTVAIRIADVFHVTVDQLFSLEYDGKPTARVAVERISSAADLSTRHERRNEPSVRPAKRKTSLADLRNVF